MKLGATRGTHRVGGTSIVTRADCCGTVCACEHPEIPATTIKATPATDTNRFAQAHPDSVALARMIAGRGITQPRPPP
jgi:hypothetical protein